MTSSPPLITLIFAFLWPCFLVMRNIYYFKLWQLRHDIDNEAQFSITFPKGIKKLMIPIFLEEKPVNIELLSLLRKINLYSYLSITTFAIAFLTGFLSSLLQ